MSQNMRTSKSRMCRENFIYQGTDSKIFHMDCLKCNFCKLNTILDNSCCSINGRKTGFGRESSVGDFVVFVGMQ